MKVFVLNAGSSSLKFQLIDVEAKTVLAKGCCDGIGTDGNFLYSSFDGRTKKTQVLVPDHTAAFEMVLQALISGETSVITGINEIDALGHRIVNGGDRFISPTLVTGKVLREFKKILDFAPLHNPAAFKLIQAALEILGNAIPNVLAFDTAFHQTMPPEAYLFGIPYSFTQKYRIRRYGAHGISHNYVSQRCANVMNKKLSELKIITCHLGNGSSIAAVDGGRCIDTSMGFSPVGGVMMGTRSGDLDPSVVTYMMEKEALTPREIGTILNKQSGLLGITGVSGDCRNIQKMADDGDTRAALSLKMLAYQIKKYIGAYTAAMGGADALVFTAGIGENSDAIRQDICHNLEYLGIKIDRRLNSTATGGVEKEITAKDAKVRTFVIPTNEEYVIALEVKKVVESMYSSQNTIQSVQQFNS